MATIVMNNDHSITVCNSLLRGELAAVDTYKQALEKVAGGDQASSLEGILGDHQTSVADLSTRITSMGGKPDTDAGAWGTFASAVQSGANLLGETSALATLKQGEEHGKRAYEDALADEQFAPPAKEFIADKLLPRVKDHIEALERLSKTE